MRSLPLIALACAAVGYVVGLPINQKKDGTHDAENEIEVADEMAENLEYHRYLMEVIQVLENDQEFRAKVKEISEEDLRSGKIAEQLQFVSHNVRTRLDEIKRKELERLRHLATKEQEMRNGLDVDHMKIAGHVDHTNTRTFEIYDLKKLIAKISKDLAETNNKRKEEFKKHEMEVKYEEQQKLNHMNEAEREKYEQELKTIQEKHKKHEPVLHPGSKQQLEEVWENQDHMEAEDFNPKTFFYMHDIDGNGVWDPDEVKALFLKELDKLYTRGASQEELIKRMEEMERMREHVFNEADLNKDALISYEEFLVQTKKPEFQKDEGWQGLDEGQIFTQEEFEEFERLRKQEEMQKMIAQGILPEHQGSIPPQHEPFPPQYAHPAPPQNYQHQQQFQHQQQYPNPAPGQVVLQQYPQQQMGAQQLHPGQVPVQQPQGQVPVQQPQGQVPIQQQPQGQVPVQQHQQQQQQQQQQYQQQQPQQQQNIANQIPQNVHTNVVSQQHNQLNSQSAQIPIQQEINRNNIPAVGKV